MLRNRRTRSVALLLIIAGFLVLLSISNVLSNNNYLRRFLLAEEVSSAPAEIIDIESLKVYEYPAPPGLTPEDLFECYQNEREHDPITDNPGIRNPYLPEDLGEWFLHKQMSDYPHKTTDPSEADIFIIDTMPILSKVITTPCNGMNHWTRQMKWVKILEESQYFTERPEDHAHVCTSWFCFNSVLIEMRQMIAPKSILVIAESVHEWFHGFDKEYAKEMNMTDPAVVIAPYVAHSYIEPLDSTTLTDVRKNKVTFIGSFSRSSKWRTPLLDPKVSAYITSHNSELRNVADESEYLTGYAQTMTDSDFCLVPSGDTQSSRRLFDAMVAGCIPVFPGPKYPLPFEHIIPYSEFSVRIDGDEWLKNAPETMKLLHEINHDEIVEMRTLMSKYIKYVDWRHGYGVLEGIIGAIELRRKSALEPIPWIGERSYH